MLKKVILSLSACLAFSSSAFSLLPPLYQDMAELKAILNDERMGQFLTSGDAIIDIRKIKKGWLVETNKHEMLVQINYIYDQSNMPGPQQFNVVFNAATKIGKFNEK